MEGTLYDVDYNHDGKVDYRTRNFNGYTCRKENHCLLKIEQFREDHPYSYNSSNSVRDQYFKELRELENNATQARNEMRKTVI